MRTLIADDVFSLYPSALDLIIQKPCACVRASVSAFLDGLAAKFQLV